jgi:hypothetical protein
MNSTVWETFAVVNNKEGSFRIIINSFSAPYHAGRKRAVPVITAMVR